MSPPIEVRNALARIVEHYQDREVVNPGSVDRATAARWRALLTGP
jgi:hypothetical protein